MYGGYGMGGMGSMYGGGFSPMYGSGMGSMYGGGMGSMYGSGMGSMYGGGMGTMGGMGSVYNSGLGTMGGMITGGPSGGANALTAAPNAQGANSLLPPQSDQPQIGLPGNAATEESPRERRARRRRERREEREAIEKHRQQKRQFAIHSTIEILGHALQILIQLMRSGLELFGVGFGTYYSIKALKALVKTQEGAVASTVAQRGVAIAGANVGGKKVVSKTSNWKIWMLISALFIFMETVYNIHQHHRDTRTQRAIYCAEHKVPTTDEDDSLEESLSQSEDCTSDEDSTLESFDDFNNIFTGDKQKKRNENQRVFIAIHDYESPEIKGVMGFKTGDRFVIEDYVENGWCEAISMDSAERLLGRGLVPGNFLRPLESATKL